MPKSPEEYDLSNLEGQQKFEELSGKKQEKYIDISRAEALKINEELADKEKLDEESYQVFSPKNTYRCNGKV